MIEKRTTMDIHLEYKDFVTFQAMSRRKFANKDWISKDSLIKELYKILNNATDKNPSSNKIPKLDIDLLILELVENTQGNEKLVWNIGWSNCSSEDTNKLLISMRKN